MPAPLLLRTMGVVVEVVTDDNEAHRRWRHQWSRTLAPEGSPVDATADAPTGGEPDAIDYTLTTSVTMAALRATQGRRVNLHAAGLADDQGRALVLVAPSGTGKSTAVRALGQHLGYLSDETVSIGSDLTIAPHAKPLSVLVDGRGWPKSQISPDDAGLGPTPDSATAAALVVLDRDATRPPGLSPLPLVEAMASILGQSSSMAVTPASMQRLAELVLRCGGAHLLTYSEITDEVPGLLELLATSRPDTTTEITHLPPPDSIPAGGPGTYARAPWHDAIHVDGEVMVLAGHQGLGLGQLGAALWLAADRPRSFDELLEAARRRLLDHPQAVALVRAGLSDLVRQGLLVEGSDVTRP